jgi:hypothetical protein
VRSLKARPAASIRTLRLLQHQVDRRWRGPAVQPKNGPHDATDPLDLGPTSARVGSISSVERRLTEAVVLRPRCAGETRARCSAGVAEDIVLPHDRYRHRHGRGDCVDGLRARNRRVPVFREPGAPGDPGVDARVHSGAWPRGVDLLPLWPRWQGLQQAAQAAQAGSRINRPSGAVADRVPPRMRKSPDSSATTGTAGG